MNVHNVLLHGDMEEELYSLCPRILFPFLSVPEYSLHLYFEI